MAKNILYTDITKAYYPKSPYILNIDNKNYPNINAGYGPYNSLKDATAALMAIYNVTELKNIPDGVLVTFYDSSKTELGFYLLVSGEFLSVGSGGGDSPYTNVISNYIFNISNPRIVVPVLVDANGKYWTTPEALKEASLTTISITDNNGFVTIENDTVDLYNASTKTIDSELKLSTITNTNKSYSFYLEFNKDTTDGTLYEITSQVFFLAFSLNGLLYLLILSVVLDASGEVYSLGSSDLVLRIDTNNTVQDLTVDIDAFNVYLKKSEKVSKDYITLEYIYDGDIYYINKDLTDGTAPTVSDSGQIKFTQNTQVYKTAGVTSGDTITFGTLASNRTSDMHFSHGDSIIIKITKGGITDYRTIIVNRASAYTGVFISPNAFVLDKNNIIIPKTYKDSANLSYLQQATKTKAYYYEGEDHYVATIESVTINEDDNAEYLINEEKTEVYLNAISDDLTITYEVSYNGNKGTLVQNISFTEADSYYVLKAQTSAIPLTDELKPVSDTDLSFVIDKVQTGKTEIIDSVEKANAAGLIIKRYEYDSNGATNTTISIPNSSGITGLTDTLSDLEENGITSGSYIEYTLCNSSNEYLAGTRVYFVKAGANGTSAHVLDLDNDAIIVDDDVDDETLQKVSETVVTPSEDINLYYTIIGAFISAVHDLPLQRYIKLNTTNSDVNLTLTTNTSFSYKTSIVKATEYLNTYLSFANSDLSFVDCNYYISITYNAYTDSDYKNLYATKKLTLKVSEIGGTYKLSISPNTIPLNNTGTLNLLNNLSTCDLTVNVYKYGKKGTFVAITNKEDFDSEGLTLYLGSSATFAFPNYTGFLVSNLISGNSTFYLKTSDGVILDSETVGYTKAGANGNPNLSIDFTNPTVIIDSDTNSSEAITKLMSNTATCYYGTTSVIANWTVSVSSDLIGLITTSNTSSSNLKSITPVFTLVTDGTKLNTSKTGYVTYTATYGESIIARRLNVIIKDFPGSNSYKLIAYPTVVSCDYLGNVYAGNNTINVLLLQISGDSGTSTSCDLSNYYGCLYLTDRTLINNYNLKSGQITIPSTYYSNGLILEIYSSRDILGRSYTFTDSSYPTGVKNITLCTYEYYSSLIEFSSLYYLLSLIPIYESLSDYTNNENPLGFIIFAILASSSNSTIKSINTYSDLSKLHFSNDNDIYELYNDETLLIGITSSAASYIGTINTLGNFVPMLNITYGVYTEYCGKAWSDIEDYTINYSYSNLLDGTNIKYTKDGAPGGTSSSGISIQQTNDFFAVDDDTTSLAESVTKNTIHVFNNGEELNYNDNAYTVVTSISYTYYDDDGNAKNDNGTILQINTGNNTNTTTIQLGSGLTIKRGSGCILYTVTVDDKTYTILQNFLIFNIPGNCSYSLNVDPNIYNRDKDTGGTFNLKITEYNKDGSSSATWNETPYAGYTEGTTKTSTTFKDGDLGVFDPNGELIIKSAYAPTSIPSNSFTLTLKVYSTELNTWVTVDSETVGIVYNGNDSTVPGAAIRFRGDYASDIKYLFNQYDDNDTSTDKVKYIDVVKYNSYYYLKNAPSEKGVSPVKEEDGTITTNTSYWTEANQYDLLITKELLVADDDGIITGGVVGGTATGNTKDIVIWSGSNTKTSDKSTSASDATFYVTDKGKVHAELAEIIGDIYARTLNVISDSYTGKGNVTDNLCLFSIMTYGKVKERFSGSASIIGINSRIADTTPVLVIYDSTTNRRFIVNPLEITTSSGTSFSLSESLFSCSNSISASSLTETPTVSLFKYNSTDSNNGKWSTNSSSFSAANGYYVYRKDTKIIRPNNSSSIPVGWTLLDDTYACYLFYISLGELQSISSFYVGKSRENNYKIISPALIRKTTRSGLTMTVRDTSLSITKSISFSGFNYNAGNDSVSKGTLTGYSGELYTTLVDLSDGVVTSITLTALEQITNIPLKKIMIIKSPYLFFR